MAVDGLEQLIGTGRRGREELGKSQLHRGVGALPGDEISTRGEDAAFERLFERPAALKPSAQRRAQSPARRRP